MEIYNANLPEEKPIYNANLPEEKPIYNANLPEEKPIYNANLPGAHRYLHDQFLIACDAILKKICLSRQFFLEIRLFYRQICKN